MLLTRTDAFHLAVFVLGAAACALAVPTRRRVVLALVGLATMVVVVVPWVVRNAVKVDAPAIATVSSDATLAGSNCGSTYGGSLLGAWDLHCLGSQGHLDEAEWSRDMRDRGLRYARGHAAKVPLVVIVRELRVLGVYHPFSQLSRESGGDSFGLVASPGVGVLAAGDGVRRHWRRSCRGNPARGRCWASLATVRQRGPSATAISASVPRSSRCCSSPRQHSSCPQACKRGRRCRCPRRVVPSWRRPLQYQRRFDLSTNS